MFWAAGRNSQSPHAPSECFSTRREIHINKRIICLCRPRRWMEHGFLSKINNSNSNSISSGYFMDAGRFSSWITKMLSFRFAFLQEGGEPALLFVRSFLVSLSLLCIPSISSPNRFYFQWTPITPMLYCCYLASSKCNVDHMKQCVRSTLPKCVPFSLFLSLSSVSYV